MRLEKGCLMIEPMDLELIQGDVDKGITVKEAFEKQVFLLGISINDIHEIQAFAHNLIPYEELILSIVELLETTEDIY